MTRIYVRRPVGELFWSHVTGGDVDSCWEWTGARTAAGYGLFGAREGDAPQKMVLAHRWAYMSLIGPIPRPLVIDHLCSNPPCVNPWHMEPVTQRVNTLRGNSIQAANAVKTECLRGHPFDAENTGPGTRGRRCRACHRDRERERKRHLRRLQLTA